MKMFFATIALLGVSAGAVVVSQNPDLLPLPLPKGGDPPVVSEGQELEAAVVPAGGQLVISHRDYEPGQYILKLTKWSDGRVQVEPMNQHVVNLDGQLVTGKNKPIPNDDLPEKESDPVKLLEQVRTNLGNDELFESQVAGMRLAMTYKTTEDMQTTHKWIHGKASTVIGSHNREWDPWWLWFMGTASQQQNIEDYRAWVDLARESLGGEDD